MTMDGVEVQLTPTEYSLLRVLVQHAGKVVTHRQLLRTVWGKKSRAVRRNTSPHLRHRLTKKKNPT